MSGPTPRGTTVLVVLLLGLGCDWTDTDVTPPGRGTGVEGTVDVPEGSREAPPLAREDRRAPQGLSPTPTRPGVPVPAAEPAQEPSTENEPRRDLSADLRGLVGDPSACLNDADPEAIPAQVRLRVTAHVSTTGVITRSEVEGIGLPEPVLACVQERLSVARLRGPVEGAPRAITTTLELSRRPPTEDPE